MREILPPDTALAAPAMLALRPHRAPAKEFVARVDGLQRAEGYRLAGSFTDADPAAPEPAASVAGFRTGHSLAWGHYLYVDDLSTLPEQRGRGHARALLEWLRAEALRLGCDQVHLDSGVGSHRTNAHRAYLAHGMEISAHHFSWPRARPER